VIGTWGLVTYLPVGRVDGHEPPDSSY